MSAEELALSASESGGPKCTMLPSEVESIRIESICLVVTFEFGDKIELIEVCSRVDGDNASSVGKQAVRPDDVHEKMFGDMRIDSAERIVEDVKIGVLIHGASERNARALATAI